MTRGHRVRHFAHDDDDLDDVAFENVECDRQTEKAIHVIVNGSAHWIPQSVVTSDSEVYAAGHKGRLVVKGWFAGKEGLS